MPLTLEPNVHITDPGPNRPQRFWMLLRRGFPAVLLSYCLLTCLLVPGVSKLLVGWNQQTDPPSWLGSTKTVPEVDTPILHAGVLAHPTFLSTLDWWHGTWAGGTKVIFFRPIPSVAFWLEWHWFGNHEDRYIVVNILFHLLVCLAFYRVTWQLARRYPSRRPWLFVSAAVWLFFQDTLDIIFKRSGVNETIAMSWKNLPDALCALFVLLALSAYLRMLEKRDNWRRDLGWTLFWYLLACCSKEVGCLLPVAFLCLELRGLRASSKSYRGAVLQRTLWTGATMLLFQIYRLSVLHTIGYRYGNNKSWPFTFFGAITYPFGNLFLMQDVMGIILTLAIYAGLQIYFWIRRGAEGRSRRQTGLLTTANLLFWAGLSVGVAVSLCLYTRSAADSWAEALLSGVFLIVGAQWMAIVSSLCWMCAVGRLVTKRSMMLLFGYAWVILTDIPNAMSPTVVHREYLPAFGFVWLIAYGSALFVSAGYDSMRRQPWADVWRNFVSLPAAARLDPLCPGKR